jgi:hypothetical protein
MTPTKFTPDGRPVYHFSSETVHFEHQTNKVTSMSTIDGLVKSLESLSPELKRELVQRLAADNIAQVSAAAAETAKRTRLSRISAARDSRNWEFMTAQGILNRAAITSKIASMRALLTACAPHPIVRRLRIRK